MGRWHDLTDRLERHTDFTPEQIDMVREQVLIVLEDSWPEPLYKILEEKEEAAETRGYEDHRSDDTEVIEGAIGILREII